MGNTIGNGLYTCIEIPKLSVSSGREVDGNLLFLLTDFFKKPLIAHPKVSYAILVLLISSTEF